MPVSMSQVTAPTSPTTIPLGTVSPGSTIIISTTSTTADVFLGTLSTVTATTGAPLDTGGPTVITNPVSGAAFTIYGTSGTGTHVVGVIVITRS